MINNKNVAYFGSRKHKNSTVKAIKKRRYLGSVFMWILEILFQIKIKDTQCGFKVFHKNYSSRVFKKLLSYRFVFDVELTLILKKKNIPVKELPLKWTHRKDEKLNLMRDIPIMFFDILMIKLREVIK